MNIPIDRELLWMVSGIVGFLSIASVIGFVLSKNARLGTSTTIANLNARIRAWWIMVLVFGAMLFIGPIGTTILFALISFLALREFITITPTRPADHRTLSWAFFIITPLQYYLVGIQWYGLFSILIPVYAFLFVPVRSVMGGDCEGFLDRIARIQWGLMICVYCVSHTPAILNLPIPGYEGQNAKLLLFLVVVVQMSDVLQYVFGKTLGRHKIAPHVSPNKTWEGFVGGVLASSALGACLWWATPFTVVQAAAIALLVNLMGFVGGLTMSAIKRSYGVKDFGNLIEGHGGILDRIDSLCFAAPVFFHVIRFVSGNLERTGF